MHLVIVLLAALAFFVYLTLGARHDPDNRKLYYLFIVIDVALAGAFLYLLLSAILDFN